MLFSEVPRLALAHTPTPLWRNQRLNELLGTDVWVKRDDMTAGAAAGNKIRKLEFLLAAAQEQKANTVITCGAAQSNHARATAICCAQLGLECHLLLRSPHADAEPNTGNLALDSLCGATIHWVTPEQYALREQRMAKLSHSITETGRQVFSIPEGGSNGLGSLGYVQAMAEIKQQLDDNLLCSPPEKFDAIVHACGSGGTAAGVGVGAAAFCVAEQLHTIAVCDDRQYFQTILDSLHVQIENLASDLPPPIPTHIHDQFIGPGYGISSPEQWRFLAQVARETGLLLDPVYSGKALFALKHGLSQFGLTGKRLLFIHTGGLPGLLAEPINS